MRLSVALVTVVFAVTGVVESARVRFYPVYCLLDVQIARAKSAPS